MKEHGILFRAEMVRAILEDRKDVTRRIVKPVRRWERYNICKPDMAADPWAVWWHGDETDRVGVLQECPYGKPEDKLWVREAWRTGSTLDPYSASKIAEMAAEAGFRRDGSQNPCCPLYYEVDGVHRTWGSNDKDDFGEPGRYRHGRFMPRWASRLLLDVVSVRVERLQNVTHTEALKEGVRMDERGWYYVPGALLNSIPKEARFRTSLECFEALFKSINGPDVWAQNPFVWRVEFKRV